MTTKRFFASAACLLLGLTALGCSSSSSAPALNGVGDVPNLDASSYDYSLHNAVEGLAKLSPAALTAQPRVTQSTFSRAACEGYTLKKRVFEDSRQIESFRCYIKSLEQANLGMTVPTGSWGYYEIIFPERSGENGPPKNVRVRVGKIDGELKMDACTAPDGVTYAREVEMRFSPTETGYAGHAINASNWTDMDGNAVTGNSKIEVTIDGTSVDSFKSATFSSFHRDQQTAKPELGWQSKSSFAADGTEKSNTLSGVQSGSTAQFGSNTSKLFGEWGTDLIGSVQFSVTGEYTPPDLAQCRTWAPSTVTDQQLIDNCVGQCHDKTGTSVALTANGKCPFGNEGTESFGITNNSSGPPTFAKVDDSTSPYFAAVSAATLPTLDDIASQVEFGETWDCSAEGSFQAIDATGLTTIASTCEGRRDNDIWRMCEEQQQAANQN
ncbi:MAG: hypothetical protein V1495_10165 [Pseudomonadota bacterium]